VNLDCVIGQGRPLPNAAYKLIEVAHGYRFLLVFGRCHDSDYSI
jgi:hypothetical protein